MRASDLQRDGEGVGRTLRAVRRQRGLSLGALAREAGCAKSYLSGIENEKKGPPADEVLLRLEQALGVRAGTLVRRARWERGLAAGGAVVRDEVARLQRDRESARRLVTALAGGLLAEGGAEGKSPLDRAYHAGTLHALLGIEPEGESAGARNEEAVAGVMAVDEGDGGKAAGIDANVRVSARARAREVPVINRVAAGYPTEFTDLSYPARVADDYARCPELDDDDAFAARVVGDSMQPVYGEGDIVVFSPARPVRSGMDCFVRFERDAQTTFKRVFFERDASNAEVVRLVALNPRYPERVLPREEVAGVYAAVQLMRKIG